MAGWLAQALKALEVVLMEQFPLTGATMEMWGYNWYHLRYRGYMMDGRNPASVDRWLIPSFVRFQPSVWWCRISQPSTVWWDMNISPTSYSWLMLAVSEDRESWHLMRYFVLVNMMINHWEHWLPMGTLFSQKPKCIVTKQGEYQRNLTSSFEIIWTSVIRLSFHSHKTEVEMQLCGPLWVFRPVVNLL